MRLMDSGDGYRYPCAMLSGFEHIGLSFMKMHGLGNDFVIVDARARDVAVSPALVRALGDRHRGVGFDQMAVISNGGTGPHLTFYNADGSVSAACGNATRCIARYLMDERGTRDLVLTTERGVLHAVDRGQGLTAVNMGAPRLDWADIPLIQEMDSLHLPIDGDPAGVNMGNPHCTFFVDDAEAVDLERFGPQIEHHPIFPQGTNVQVAHLAGPGRIRMRVWERGVGITLASGSSSCATAVAAARRGLTGRTVRIELDGGPIDIAWKDDGVWMTGTTTHQAH
ncbi:MAG: diaminopimelate epimerase [Rhodobacteraceae bacterium]|nr:diaminopimelate epimerase [Paracoccaceae bacterium]